MAHSVEADLALSPEEYDAGIRRFVPFYEEMLSCAVDWLSRMPAARLTLLDVDAAMLAQARERLGPGPTLVCGSFFDPLPPCDIAVASLSLHHVRDLDERRALNANIRRALPPGGALLDADVALPSPAAAAKAMEDDWAAHLVAHGDTAAQARARFAAWAEEFRGHHTKLRRWPEDGVSATPAQLRRWSELRMVSPKLSKLRRRASAGRP